MTLCTVAIPVYNRQDMIGQAVASACNQSLRGLEILVVDNCSTDGTWDSLRSIRHPSLRLERNKTNLGLFANFNRCLDLARGKFLRFLCSDDLLWTECLAEEVALMERHADVVLLSTRGWMTDAKLNRVKKMGDYLSPGIYPGGEAISASLWALVNYGSPFNFPSGILLRTQQARQTGGFDLSLNHLGDIDFWFRLLRLGDLAISASFGCQVRDHSGQESNRLLLSGKFTDEWFVLVQRWGAELRRRGLYEQVFHQVGATALRIALHYYRVRNPAVARLYWRAALTGVPSRWALLVAMLRLLGTTLLAQTCGIRFQPPDFFKQRRHLGP